MELQEIRPGLRRWTAPHPEWEADATPESPADWPRDVGCVLYDAAGTVVLIDPLLPPDPEPFWAVVDEHVRRRDVSVAVLTTIGFHRRSRDAFVERFGATTSAPEGVESFPVERTGETIFWLPEHGALVPGDRILGDDAGGLRVCPDSWLRYLRNGITGAELREALRPLLELPIESVLVSHGEPVLSGGREALERALADHPD
jgi:hypothetical protein